MVKNLRKVTGLKLKPASNYFEAMQSMLPFMELSSAINNFAIDITKITNDEAAIFRSYNGFAEQKLPYAVQPGFFYHAGKS
jgi:aspartate ammonia-lyase